MIGPFQRGMYSVVPIKQVGWNKRVGWEKMQKLIKELD